MKRKRQKKVSIRGNCSFIWHKIVLVSILSVSIALSILDRLYHIVSWPDGFENIVEVSLQIITTIISLIVSVIGIAISLQNEEFFGVKITKLYALRVSKHDSILKIIILSIILCVLNLLFYIFNLTIAALGTSVVSFLFLLRVVNTEVPIMLKQENAILQILKNNLIKCHLNKSEASKDLKDSVKYLLWNKTIKELYLCFKDESDESYNQYVILKLLEFQEDLAFELKDMYSENEQHIIACSLLGNVYDILYRNVEISNDIYAKISKNKYMLTRVLFRVYEVTEVRNQFLTKIRGLFQYLCYSSPSSKVDANLLSEIIVILVAETIKANNFEIIKTIRRQLSDFKYCLTKASPALDVFAVLSMYLYYLSCSDPDVPNDIKQCINAFVIEGNIIEENTKITSWRSLFSEAAINFCVNYNRFVAIAMRYSDTLQYYLFGNGAKIVILDLYYLSQWYLTHLLNIQQIREIDFSDLVHSYPKIKKHLKGFGDRCFDDNKNFIPSEEMNQIVEFYSGKTKHFVFFKAVEDHNHNFWHCINGLRLDELMVESKLAADMDNSKLAEKIQRGLETAIRNEWGYDFQLPIHNAEYCFSAQFEKSPYVVNLEESIIGYCIDRIWTTLENAVQKTVVYYGDQFEPCINTILSKNPKYVTNGTKNTLPFYISDERLKKKYVETCGKLEEFQSKILGYDVIVLNDGFRFNCKIENVEFRELIEEELSQQVAQHQRADGQYVYDGVFLPQEEIAKVIRLKYTILNIVLRYQVISSKEEIFELKPYLSDPKH